VNGKTTGTRVERQARLRWVPLNLIKVNPLAQRELNTARVDKLTTEFDPEQFGVPTVSARDTWYFVIDGQHRIEAYKQWNGDGRWESQQIQCWTYEGLSEEQEADVFLKLNDTLTVNAFAKFRVGVRAGRAEEVDIERIVRTESLRISQAKGNGAVSAVGTLKKVYQRAGGDNLARALRIARDAYGDPGLEAVVIEGLGLLCHRYNGDLDDIRVVQRLSTAHGGLAALLGKAENLRKQTGNPRGHCVAAAAVDIINGSRGGRKLPSWWKAAA
jgi:hypothetical protein